MSHLPNSQELVKFFLRVVFFLVFVMSPAKLDAVGGIEIADCGGFQRRKGQPVNPVLGVRFKSCTAESSTELAEIYGSRMFGFISL